MKLDWDHWGYSLGKAVIGGVATTITAFLGAAGGHAITEKVALIDWTSLGFILLTASISNLGFYLAKSPLPRDLEDDKTPDA